ncbi:npr-14 [Pristionchus pacificus]|uniref:Npr-14 n=1 Tax=Pristionchus pacificus TaxID=54126 RepID=A0A2A6BDI7_PRIPA|nr:npr-14 [Pristionchus pacificus]|eukprot:PDM63918.1 npr-14 [Pristionchus pacificus]
MDSDFPVIDETSKDQSFQDYENYVIQFLSPRPVERYGLVVFAFIMFIGVAGNCLVIRVVSSTRRMASFFFPFLFSLSRSINERTSMNILLMNLAVADLIILLICLPTTVLTDVTKTFWFGVIPCKGIVFVQNTGVYVSVLTLTFISYERWKAVTDPLDVSIANKKIVIPVIWIIAMILSTPEPFTLQIESPTFDRPNFTTTWGTQCRVSWSPQVEKPYVIFQSLVFYILPLIMISCLCYSTISTLNDGHLALGRRQIGTRKKAVRMLSVVVFVFALSYLPVHAHNIIIAFSADEPFSVDDTDVDISAVRKLLARVFSYSSSSLNPILYNILCQKNTPD